MVPAATVPIDQRFAQLIQQFGLTKNSFAISLGKTASVVQHLIDGRNKPGYDLLCKVFEIYPNVSRDWLLLGRGPMLVSGGPTAKPAAAVAPPTPELPLEPIDLSDVEAPSARRSGLNGARLQPTEIAATLALAAVATQPARAAAPAPMASLTSSESAEASAPAVQAATATAVHRVIEPASDAPASVIEPVAPQSVVVPAASVNVPAPVALPVAALGPEVYVAAALNAQHLQHQLALAELRNQHLVEQQQMLREMLAMARQAMV